MSLLRPSFNCGPRLVQIGKREGKRQLEKESKTIYTKNYYRLLWALRLYMAFAFFYQLPFTFSFTYLHQTWSTVEGWSYQWHFYFKCSCDFRSPTRTPKHDDPPPVSYWNPFIYWRKHPPFLLTMILSKIWVRFSHHLVGRHIVVSLIQLSGLLVESKV